MPLAVDHVLLPATDAAATSRFYGEVLGLPLVGALSGDDWEGAAWLMMAFGLADGRQIVLTAFRGRATVPPRAWPADVPHHAFSVASREELATWRERLTAAGVEIRAEDHGSQESIYFEDPSGNTLEITAPPSATTSDASAVVTVERWIAATR